MKTSVYRQAIFCTVFLLTSSLLQSQSCTQCDNSGDPPGLLASEIGQGTTASGDYSFAGGINSQATNGLSFAFGSNALASGTHSFALGMFCSANATNSFAIGADAKATAPKSMVIGYGMGSGNILENNIDGSIMLGIGSEKPTVFIGNGSGVGATGKVGIGDVTEPQAKLHIKADNYETALVFIEPHSFTGGESARLRLGTLDYGISAGYGKLFFVTGGNYLFNSEDANVGLGVPNPRAKLQVNGNVFIDNENAGMILKSPDGQCWKITVNNNGELSTLAIDCDLLTGKANLQETNSDVVSIYPNPTDSEVTIENKSTAPMSVTFRDMNGALLYRTTLASGINTIDVSHFKAGYYLLSVTDRDNKLMKTEKLLKQ